jgi:high affinity Mn2+ porin
MNNNNIRTRTKRQRSRLFATALGAALVLLPFAVLAQQVGGPDSSADAQAPASGSDAPPPSFWNVHIQATNTSQLHPSFPAPYSGPMSLDPRQASAETTDVTLFAGLRLWNGAAVYVDPEVDQGFGLSNTVGLAGFSSGEAYKIGANVPYPRLQRAFLRQIVSLGGDAQDIDDGPNQLGGSSTVNNLTLTLGKLSVVDIFDTNDYAHDARADFFNWSVIDAGAFDYAADSWGFTYGGALEWTQDFWTLRGGLFDLSTIPNGKQPDPGFGEYEVILEAEERHQWHDHPGKLKVLAFYNHGQMASYTDALAYAAETGTVPAVAQVRRGQSRTGLAVNFQQELAGGLGVFARASVAQGDREAYEFTDIDQSVSGGVSLHGDRWGKPDDTVGLAMVVNSLSLDAERYLNAGGLGILIGDGRLNYGLEQICEGYYALQLKKGIAITFDYQFIENPAYNRDRGPVSIFGLRLHAEL